jgi:hypothetical protein
LVQSYWKTKEARRPTPMSLVRRHNVRLFTSVSWNTDLIYPVSSHNIGQSPGNVWSYPQTVLTNQSDETSSLSMPPKCVNFTAPQNITYHNYSFEESQPGSSSMMRSDTLMNRYEFRAPGVFYTVPMAPQQRKQSLPSYVKVSVFQQR